MWIYIFSNQIWYKCHLSSLQRICFLQTIKMARLSFITIFQDEINTVNLVHTPNSPQQRKQCYQWNRNFGKFLKPESIWNQTDIDIRTEKIIKHGVQQSCQCGSGERLAQNLGTDRAWVVRRMMMWGWIKARFWKNWSSMFLSSSVQSLSHVQLFAITWTAARQASLSITNSWRLLKLMSIESVMPSNSFSVILFSACLQSFPASGSFQMSQFFISGGQNIGVSTSAPVLPMNI